MGDDDVKLCGGFAAVVDGLDAMLQHRKSLIQELAAMTARAELNERLAAWSRAEAAKGVQG